MRERECACVCKRERKRKGHTLRRIQLRVGTAESFTLINNCSTLRGHDSRTDIRTIMLVIAPTVQGIISTLTIARGCRMLHGER